jgi:hypothetical protein
LTLLADFAPKVRLDFQFKDALNEAADVMTQHRSLQAITQSTDFAILSASEKVSERLPKKGQERPQKLWIVGEGTGVM